MNIKGENLRSPISAELSDILMEYIDKDERANVHATTGVSLTTIQKVCRREGVITKKNVPAIVELMRISRNNCLKSIAEAESAIALIDHKLKPEE